MHRITFILLALLSTCYKSYALQTINKDIKYYQHQRGHPEGIDIAFVLMDSTKQELIAQQVKMIGQELNSVAPADTSPFIIQEYNDIPVRIPHVSVGQYGVELNELESLKTIVDSIAPQFSPIIQSMQSRYNIKGYNINLTVENTGNESSPVVIDLYKKLRMAYEQTIQHKFMITHAHWQKDINHNKPRELELLSKYYQNWNMPEDGKLDPHYTLVYIFKGAKDRVTEILRAIHVPQVLKTLTFDQLGIVEIDFWGNPIRMIHTAKLRS